MGPGVIRHYSLQMGNRADISDKLDTMGDQPGKFFRTVLDYQPSDILVDPERQTMLSGYSISANHGIGTVSGGGVEERGVRSDSPFLLEVYKAERTHEQNLAAVIGFWAQDNDLLVSQMQSCRAAELPPGVNFGVACLSIAEKAARLIGFDRVIAYSAKQHPIFKEHSDSWQQLNKDFVCIWDNSARKRGFEPYEINRNGVLIPSEGRKGFYVKDLRSNH